MTGGIDIIMASTLSNLEQSDNDSLFCQIKKIEESQKRISYAQNPNGITYAHNANGVTYAQNSNSTACVQNSNGESHSAITVSVNTREIEESSDTRSESKENVFSKQSRRLSTAREYVGAIVQSSIFQTMILLLIIVNALMMGIATFDFVSKNPDIDNMFETCDFFFLLIFTVESGLQLFYHGKKFTEDSWLCFDFGIVVFSWLFSAAQIIRSFRVFRVLRVTTHMKTMRDLIEALFKTIPRLLGVATLLILIMYIFSVMFTELFRDLWFNGISEYPYFARLDGSMLTSFQMLTFDNWAEIAREAMEMKSWAWIPFVAFIVISGFTVINLVIAVICDAINDLQKEDLDKLYLNIFTETNTQENESTNENHMYQTKFSVDKKMDQIDFQIQNLHSSNDITLYKLKELSIAVEMMVGRSRANKKKSIFNDW